MSAASSMNRRNFAIPSADSRSKLMPIVNTSVAKVTIQDATIAIVVGQFLQVPQICAQLLRGNRRVFPAFPVRWLARDARYRAQRGFPDLPYFSRLTTVSEQPER